MKMNHLSQQKSPYLLQHKNNPVDWYPWGDAAFDKAKKENKPIFLSIGYSTCHWCHVMERESFENEETAALMNKYFVNIKVDREERPDVDKVYMTAVQTMSGHGGWPLSVFLTPDLKPFYGGTYFPPKDVQGRPGFPSLLERINEVWQNERENVIHSGDELLKELQHRHPVDSRTTEIDETILKRTYHQIAAGYDPKHAGFGTGTKFPRPVVFNFLFRYYYRTKDQEALKMSLTTLMAMASGGMYDHLGGGFHRYSVDPQWRVPHFEKMLYDQAQLVHSYLDAYQITHDEFFASVARETVDYVLRDMTTGEGGFCSAEDADSTDPDRGSRSVEGAFYTWKMEELVRLLSPEEAHVFCHHYSIEEKGNVHSDPHNEFTGKNILFNPFTVEQTSEHLSLGKEQVLKLLFSARQKLFTVRSARPRPLRDDKILASWNGLMIGACARAAAVLNSREYREAAVRAAEFLYEKLYNKGTRQLFRRYRDGEVGFDAHLDDYAFVISGLMELYTATFDVRWIRWAEDLSGSMIALFWDSAEGGFYDTSGKDPSILVRMKEAYDGAEPTGNSMAALSLLQMYHRTNDERLNTAAEKTLKYFCALLEQSPQIMPHLMAAVEYFLAAPQHLVIAADDITATVPLRAVLSGVYQPHLNIVMMDKPSKEFFVPRFPFMKEMAPILGRPAAFLCKDFSCRLPVTTPAELSQQLEHN
jgi:uncharacterized protein YyaL (SSP411 family)